MEMKVVIAKSPRAKARARASVGGGSTAALLTNWSLVEPTTGEAAAKWRTRVGCWASAQACPTIRER